MSWLSLTDIPLSVIDSTFIHLIFYYWISSDMFFLYESKSLLINFCLFSSLTLVSQPNLLILTLKMLHHFKAKTHNVDSPTAIHLMQEEKCLSSHGIWQNLTICHVHSCRPTFKNCWEKLALSPDCFWCFPSHLLPPPVFPRWYVYKKKNLCQSQGVTFLDWTNLSHLCPANNVDQIVTFDNHVRKLMQAIRVIRHRLDTWWGMHLNW